jgi:hypothetical protein
MSDIAKTIKDYHKTSLKGILFILKKRKTFRKWPFVISLMLSLAICILVAMINPLESFHVLQVTSDLIMAVFPNLLGFSLGGYAIVVGFSNTELLKRNARVDKYSIYQLLSSIFSISILFQIFTTILCFFITLVIKVDITTITKLYIPTLAYMINLFFLMLLIFGSIYSLLLTPYIVTNLFTLSQLNNLFFTLQKLESENIENKKDEGGKGKEP